MRRSRQQRVDVAGSWVTADVYGDPDGPAIVLVPGVMADAAAWGGVAQDLEGWQTAVVINRRGRRPSGPLTDAYGLATEVGDAAAVMREFTDVRTLFGWSFGGLIALHLASTVSVPQLIAYEPVMAPFGANALPDLRQARDAADLDGSVEIALRQVAGMGDEAVSALRSQDAVWTEMRRLSIPIYAETLAINEAPQPDELAAGIARVDLIVGERNQGQPPYGTLFSDVARRVPHAAVHQLAGQAHLAHLEAPADLAALVNQLGAAAL